MSAPGAVYRVRSLRFRPSSDVTCEWTATLAWGSKRTATLRSLGEARLDVEFQMEIHRDHFVSYAKQRHPHLTADAATEEELAILIYEAYAGQRAQVASRKQVVFTLHDDLATPRVVPRARMSPRLIGCLQLAYGARLARVYGA